jgi:hypothetical protein
MRYLSMLFAGIALSAQLAAAAKPQTSWAAPEHDKAAELVNENCKKDMKGFVVIKEDADSGDSYYIDCDLNGVAKVKPLDICQFIGVRSELLNKDIAAFKARKLSLRSIAKMETDKKTFKAVHGMHCSY